MHHVVGHCKVMHTYAPRGGTCHLVVTHNVLSLSLPLFTEAVEEQQLQVHRQLGDAHQGIRFAVVSVSPHPCSTPSLPHPTPHSCPSLG